VTDDLARFSEDERLATTIFFPCDVERLPNGNTLIADAGDLQSRGSKVVEVSPLGEIVWRYEHDLCFAHGAKRLPNGNTLIADTNNNRVIEVTREGDVVFSTDDWGGGTGRLSDGSRLDYPNDCHLLEDGALIITDRNNDRCVITDRYGTVLWSYDEGIKHPHNCDVLPNGNVLIADSDGKVIIEVNRHRSIVWSYGDGTPETLNWPRDADRLPNGNTLITDSKNSRLLEVSPSGSVVWQYRVPHFANFYDADKLPDGNVLVSDQQHRQVLEVNPAGDVVWRFRNFEQWRPINPRLINGSFRERDADGLPTGWILATRLAEGGATLIWDESERPRPCPGVDCQRWGAAYLQQLVAVVPGVRYTVTGQLRTALEDDAIAYIQMAFMDDTGGYLGDAATMPRGRFFAGTEDWAQDTFETVVPHGTAYAEIRVVISGRGRMWVRGMMMFG